MFRLKILYILLAVALAAISASSCGGQSATENLLASEIATVNATCPDAIDEVTTMAGMDDDGKWVTYHMVVSGNAEVNDLDQTMELMREYIGAGLASNPETIKFAKLLIETGRGLRYEFKFAGDGTQRCIDYTIDDLIKISDPTQQ